jgi:small neutral amino acid transporter SnatA (MarC family)
MPGRQLVRVVVLWGFGVLAVGATARAVVALPEECGPATPTERRAASEATVAWFGRTQAEDGTFLYRVDATTGEVLPGYSWVRHAGVLLSLEQARAAGIASAGDVAEAGWRALDTRVVRWGDRAGVRDGERITGGGTALALVALAERRDTTGLTDRDDLLKAMGRQMLVHTNADGTVAELADATSGQPEADSLSRFTTGEVSFALARLERMFPGEGWGAPVRAITRYLALQKAAREGFVPDMADHWGAYTLAEVVRWRDDNALTDWERAWARKQMGMSSVMIRYESQRTNSGVDRWLRGRTSVGSAVGTHGESMQGWVQVADADPELAALAAGARERLECNSAVLVDRQVTAPDAADLPDPDAVVGTWLWFGTTQMDDQQHALSALLGADLVLDAAPVPDTDGSGALPRRAPSPESAVLALFALLLAIDPVRLARRTRRVERRWVAIGSAGSGAVLVGVALCGSAVLSALAVSVPTGVITAGAVLTLAALVSAVGTWRPSPEPPIAAGWRAALVPVAVPSFLRPSALIMALVLGPAGRTEMVVLAVVAAAALGVAAHAFVGSTRSHPAIERWAEQLTALCAVAVGVFLIVDGVFAI